MFMQPHHYIIEWRCSITAREIMDILSGVSFYIYISKSLAKTVSVSKHMTVASQTNAPRELYMHKARSLTGAVKPDMMIRYTTT